MKNLLLSLVTLLLLLPKNVKAADTLIGTFDVNYRYNAAGCAPSGGPNDGNPYFCPSGIPPGPHFIDAAPGQYKLVVDAGQGCGVWNGDASSGTVSGTGHAPGEIVYLDHQFGQIVLFYWDWYVLDNDPSIQTTISLFQVLEECASFQGLGDLSGGDFFSEAWGVSADGSAVAGISYSSSGREAFRWEGGVMSGLGDLPSGRFDSLALGISGDGRIVVGYSSSTPIPQGGYDYEAFRWENGIMTRLGFLPDFEYSYALAASADGSVVLGVAGRNSGGQAVRWTDGVISALGFLPGDNSSAAYGISADLRIIVGKSSRPNGFESEAVRWDNGVIAGLGDFPGGIFLSQATGISADGQVIVGFGSSDSAIQEAARWDGGVMTGLGDLPGGDSISIAEAVSGDGSIVVGWGTTASGTAAFIWDATQGMRNLQEVLVNDFQLNLTGWQLLNAKGISADGTTIVGLGTNPQGQPEAWRARICQAGTGEPLAIICPADIITSAAPGECTVAVNFAAATTGGQPPVTIECNPPSGTAFPIGTTTVNCTATDAAGNEAACAFTVTVEDKEAPQINCPANLTVNMDPGQCSAVVSFSVRASDLCSTATVVCDPPSGSTFPNGTTTVNCTATDAAGNEAACSFTITVEDDEAPQITCPGNKVVNATSPTGATVDYAAPVASDNCGTPTVTCSRPSGSVIAIGTTTVTCTDTDAGGNTSSCSFTVTVKGASAQLNDLMTVVNRLQINPSARAWLMWELLAARAAVNSGNTQLGCVMLRQFTYSVRSLWWSNVLSSSQATSLIADANRIRAVLGCR